MKTTAAEWYFHLCQPRHLQAELRQTEDDKKNGQRSAQ